MPVFTRKPTPIECQKVVELVTAYIEGTLKPRDRERLDVHLADCQLCTSYLAQIRETIAITGAIAPEQLSDQALEDLHDVFRAWAAEDA